MKTHYHCTGHYENSELRHLLFSLNIHMKEVNSRLFVIDFDSDTPYSDELLRLLRQEENPLILKWAVYSKKEMQEAQWYSMGATMLSIDTKNWEYTYASTCPYEIGGNRYHHMRQIRPFVSNRMPKWKPRFNFCGVETGDFHTIFCSDEAQRRMTDAGITGIEYQPVLKGDMTTPRENIQQLFFPHILPQDALIFTGEYHKNTCPICGSTAYEFTELNMDNWRVKPDEIPAGIDAFATETTFDPGQFHDIVISKKLYHLLIEEMGEKHLKCRPVG